MSDTKKYLDLIGLGYYDGKIKGWTNEQIAAAIAPVVNGYVTKSELEQIVAELEAADAALGTRIDGVKATADAAATLWGKFLAGIGTDENGNQIVAPTLVELATKAELAAAKEELEGSISDVNDDVVALGTRIDNVESTHATDKAALEAADLALGTRIDNVESTHATDKAALEAADLALGTRIDDVESTHATDKAALEAADLALGTRIDNVEAKADKNAEDIVAAKEELNLAIGTVDGKVDANTDRIETLESQITGLTGAVHFKGVVNVLPAVEDSVSGDIVVYVYDENIEGSNKDLNGKEYIFANGAWVELGDTSAELEAIHKNADDIAALSSTHATDKAALEAADLALGTRIDNVESTHATDKAALEAADLALGTRIDNVESTHATDKAALEAADLALGTRIDNVEAKADKNAEDIAAFVRIAESEIDNLFPAAEVPEA